MSGSHPLRDAALALSLLTVVPTGISWPKVGRVAVAGWFPVVGFALGGLAWAATRFVPATFLAEKSYLVAVALVVWFAVVSRFLHHDGLADVADAWWGASTPERRLEIMRDTATGAFGATALALCVVVQVVSLGEVLEARGLWVLLVVPTLARLAATFAAWLGKPAREGGLGRSVMGGPDVFSGGVAALVVSAVLVIGWNAAGLVGIAFVAAGIVASLVIPHLIASRMGGVTGDVMGASVIVVETLLLFSAGVIA